MALRLMVDPEALCCQAAARPGDSTLISSFASILQTPGLTELWRISICVLHSIVKAVVISNLSTPLDMSWFWRSSDHIDTPVSSMKAEDDRAIAIGCPLDDNARQAWLSQTAQSRHSTTVSSPSTAPLRTDRVVSSIPRALADSTSTPANSEAESGQDRSGMWIYPSERMFFEAMKRKSHNPKAEDMAAIVPIHNAVNERVWREICDWERGQGGEKCGGPRLLSFAGSGVQNLSPRARWNVFLGYTAPFDRHDWVVERCGRKIEYVIDFYSGRDERKPGKSLNFYLDVRPKLNTWAGWEMRARRCLGMLN